MTMSIITTLLYYIPLYISVRLKVGKRKMSAEREERERATSDRIVFSSFLCIS